jgi:hypothetical protein
MRPGFLPGLSALAPCIWALCIPAVGLVVGCGSRGEGDLVSFPDGGPGTLPASEENPAEPFTEASGEDAPTLALDLGTGPIDTRESLLRVTGTGPSRGTLVYRAPNGTTRRQLDESGRFCIKVLLQPNSENQLLFQAHDTRGRHSQQIQVTVRHSAGGQPSPPAQPAGRRSSEPFNAALGSRGMTANFHEIHPRNIGLLVDDDTAQYVTLTDIAAGFEWVTIPLDERVLLREVRIFSAPDCPLERFEVAWSDDPEPPREPLESAGIFGHAWKESWTMVQVDNSSDRATERSVPMSNVYARHIALYAYSRDCGGQWLVNTVGKHRISEIQAWGVPVSASESDETQTCEP